MIVHLNRRLRDRGLRNVTTILAPPDDPLLPDGSIDRFFFCDVWHHVEKQDQYFVVFDVGGPLAATGRF